MKIALTLLLALIAAGGLVALMGSLVPLAHVAARSARFNQRPDALWGRLTDFAELPTWAPEMLKVERVADLNGHPVWLHTGERWSAPMEVVEFDPPRRFTLRIADPKAKLAEIEARLDALRSPFRAVESFVPEDIIDPRDTRPLLCAFADMAAAARRAGPVRQGLRP
jgi:hypothetical protein